MAGSKVYNATDGPLLIDAAGRVLGAREHRDDVDVTRSPVAGHIAAGRLVVVEDPAAGGELTPAQQQTAAAAPSVAEEQAGHTTSTTRGRRQRPSQEA